MSLKKKELYYPTRGKFACYRRRAKTVRVIVKGKTLTLSGENDIYIFAYRVCSIKYAKSHVTKPQQ